MTEGCHLHDADALQALHQAGQVLLARATQGGVVVAAPGVQNTRGGEGQSVHATHCNAAHVLALQGRYLKGEQEGSGVGWGAKAIWVTSER